MTLILAIMCSALTNITFGFMLIACGIRGNVIGIISHVTMPFLAIEFYKLLTA